jgi:PAS domain S-box-containing protein
VCQNAAHRLGLLLEAGRFCRSSAMASARRKSQHTTGMRPMKARLRAAEDLFHRLPAACLRVDLSTRITAVNRSACALLGFDAEALLGQPLASVGTAEFRDAITAHLRHPRKHDEPRRLDVVVCTHAGQQVPMQLASVRLPDRVDGWLVVLQGGVLAASPRRAARTAAPPDPSASDTAFVHAVSALSHDLRTPLLPALVGASMLVESPALDPSGRRIAATIQRNVETAAHLIEQWLESHTGGAAESAHAAPGEPSTAAPSEPPLSGISRSARARRVLIIEHDAESASLLETLLRGEGHVVAVARSAAEALSNVTRGWDVVVSDVNLPDASALDIVQQLKAHRPAPRIIALTGRGSEAERQAILQAGFDIHLLKPVKADTLMHEIEAAPRLSEPPSAQPS